MAETFIRFKSRSAFAALVKKLPTELQASFNSLLESVAFRSELESYVSSAGDLISHTTLSDIGTTTHAGIDAHIADEDIHWEQGDIDHTQILNIGSNSHVQLDAHLAHKTGHPNQVVNATEPADSTLSVNQGAFWYELV